ncbi:MAG: hypothetical protein NC122_02680 [Faecalibacterium sp.]|nr:hypothetical protein [Ruminococcus sp.]MCM1391416.1 hypothetical protein [Ruminococcus sp.]MCM1485090.1 hypothetical protein [Faecalibacterium sp.]
MSYCVNCGVELDDSAKKCALCDTVVINPSKPDAVSKAPFSVDEHIPKPLNRKFVAYIISMTMLIPNIVCFLLNLTVYVGRHWAIYVNATSFLVWVLFVFPFCAAKLRPYLLWLFDTIASFAYVYFFFALGYERQIAGWFYTCAMPIISAISLFVLIYMIWIRRKKRHWVLKAIAVMADIALVSLITGLVIEHALAVSYALEIGFIIFISCAVLTAFLVYCYASKSMRRWLERKFFI